MDCELNLVISDITTILYHYDVVVVQQAYDPYKVGTPSLMFNRIF